MPPLTVGLRKYACPGVSVAPEIPKALPIVLLNKSLLTEPPTATTVLVAVWFTTTPNTSALTALSAFARVNPRVGLIITMFPEVSPVILGVILIVVVVIEGPPLPKATLPLNVIFPLKVTPVFTLLE